MAEYDSIIADSFGFMRSRVIITAAEIDLFTFVAEKTPTAKELAQQKGLDPRALARLMDSLVALDLLEKEGEKYRVTGKGAFLSSRHGETILPVVLHLKRLWDGWSYLTDTVRKGAARAIKHVEIDDASRGAFIGAMHVIGRTLSVEIADAYDASRFRRLLDIGGASGTYAIAFLRKNLQMKATVFDLKSVITLAKRRIKAEGLSNRVTFSAGDFYKDDLPGGCDLALLSAIIHQNSIEQNIELFRKTLRALDAGGTMLIRDHIMDKSRTRPSAGTLFALNMLVNTIGGDTYTFGEVKDALERAGFVDVKLLRTGDRMDCLVEARKPV